MCNFLCLCVLCVRSNAAWQIYMQLAKCFNTNMISPKTQTLLLDIQYLSVSVTHGLNTVLHKIISIQPLTSKKGKQVILQKSIRGSIRESQPDGLQQVSQNDCVEGRSCTQMQDSSGSKDSKCSFNAVNSQSPNICSVGAGNPKTRKNTHFSLATGGCQGLQTGIWACMTDALVVVTVTSFHCVSIAKLNLHYVQVGHQNLETCVKVSQFPLSYSNLHIQASVRGI